MKKLILFAISVATASAQYLSPFAPPPFLTDPATCYAGQIYFNPAGGGYASLCKSANTWKPVISGPSSGVTGGFIPGWGTTPIGYELTAGYAISGAFPTPGTPSAVVITNAGGKVDPSLVGGSYTFINNEHITGTVLVSLAKIVNDGGAPAAKLAATTDTAVPVWIVQSNTSNTGQATLLQIGSSVCNFDSGGTNIGDFIVASTTTAGNCHSAGSGFPASGWVIGIARSASIGAGLAIVQITTGDYASSGGGGGVSSIGLGTPGSGFVLTSSTTNPITSTGTINLTFSNESANTAFIGPCSGASTAPAWRTLCYADLPGSVGTATGTSGTVSYDLTTGGIQTITITGNVTANSVSGGVAGKLYDFHICQNGTGGFTYVWPAGFHGPMSPGLTASQCSDQTFAAVTSGTFFAVGPGVINQ